MSAPHPATHVAQQQPSAALLVPITDVDTLRASGIAYPSTYEQWRWMFRRREEHGVADAFLRQGRRILVDVPKYLELARSSR
jgi:hypothetical protein